MGYNRKDLVLLIIRNIIEPSYLASMLWFRRFLEPAFQQFYQKKGPQSLTMHAYLIR